MEHTRIDEGVKRGPRKPPKPSIRARDKKGRNLPTIPKDLNPTKVLLRYLADEKTADIANSYGVSRPALNMWLLDRDEDGWRKAQIARAISKKEQAEDELEDAPDPLTLARAREKLRSAQWELERLFSRLFGQKSHVTVENVSDLGDRLRRARERAIEPEDAQVIHSAAAQLPQDSTEITKPEEQEPKVKSST